MRFPRISLAISFLGILALLALVFEGCAFNAAGPLIGSGTSAAAVITGETTTVNVTVGQVHTPSITASLTPALGSAQSLAFAVAANGSVASSP